MATPDRPSMLRPVVHAGTGLCALLLGVLPPQVAITCAAAGVLIGWVVFPLTGIEEMLRRDGERWPGGLRTYPLAVFGLVLLLPAAEAAAAWAILAFGDAAAAVVGGRVPSGKVFGHKKATWTGTVAHLLVGGLAAWGVGSVVGAMAPTAGLVEAGPVPSLAAAFAAASAAVLVDLLVPLPDDNLSCAAAAGGVLYLARGLL